MSPHLHNYLLWEKSSCIFFFFQPVKQVRIDFFFPFSSAKIHRMSGKQKRTPGEAIKALNSIPASIPRPAHVSSTRHTCTWERKQVERRNAICPRGAAETTHIVKEKKKKKNGLHFFFYSFDCIKRIKRSVSICR